MKTTIIILTSALLLSTPAHAAFSTWEVTGTIDSVTNGGSALEAGDTFVFRFRVNTDTPGVVTPPGPAGDSSATFSGALSNLKVSTFPIGPNLEATSGDVEQYNGPYFDSVSYIFDSGDGVVPGSLLGKPFDSGELTFVTVVLTPGFPETIKTPNQVFSNPDWTHFTLTWGAGASQIHAQGRVTNLAGVLGRVFVPKGLPVTRP